MENRSIATVGKPHPDYNPDRVQLVCPLFCELHGYAVGQVVPTLQTKVVGARDSNGYAIYVHSIRWNRSEWVSSSEYSLITEKEAQ